MQQLLILLAGKQATNPLLSLEQHQIPCKTKYKMSKIWYKLDRPREHEFREAATRGSSKKEEKRSMVSVEMVSQDEPRSSRDFSRLISGVETEGKARVLREIRQ